MVLMAARDSNIASILFRNALAKQFDLSMTESLSITLLGIGLARTPTELARFTGLTTGSTTTMLDRLERRGIIRRTPNPDDRRGTIIEFNEDYEKEAAAQVAGIQKAHKKLISRYTKAELAVIADFLRRFEQNLLREIDLKSGAV